MRRIISLFLVLAMLFGALAINCFAAEEKLNIKVTASGEKYKITWSYKTKVDKFYVFVDNKYDGQKLSNAKKTYSFTTDPYTRGEEHTVLVKAIVDGETYVNSEKVICVLTPEKAKVSYSQRICGYNIKASIPRGKNTGYALYSYNSSSKKCAFKKLFSSSVNISSRKTDKYVVRAYTFYDKKYYLGPCSSVISCKSFDGIKLSSAKSSKAGKLSITWKKPSFTISGYQLVYSSYDNFEYPHFITVANGKTSHTFNLVAGVCYKVGVRAYKESGGKTYYGKWSNIKTLYTKAVVGKTVDAKALINSKTLGSGGKTSCERLNNALDKIIVKSGASKQKDTYNKVVCLYHYIGEERFKKDGLLGAKGSTYTEEYSEQAVLQMLTNKGQTGSCYEYNYLFHFLCKKAGIPGTYIANGTVSASGGGRTGHYWAMMKIGTNNYFFDPRMQRYEGGASGLTFFCLPMNGDNRHSDYYRFCDAENQLK